MLRGLAENPAVPVDVLMELLREWPEPVAAGLVARADLPSAVQEQLAGHGSWRVRVAVARYPRLDPVLRDRLLGDPDRRVRAGVFGTRDQQPPLPEETLTRAMTGVLDQPDDPLFTPEELFGELLWADWNRVFLAGRHPDPRVRKFAAVHAWHDDLRQLLTDPDYRVAEIAAASVAEHERIMQPADLPRHHCHATWNVLQRPLSPALAQQIAASGDLVAVRYFTRNATIPPHLVDALSRHADAEVRAGVAARTDLTAEQVAALAADPDDDVRTVISTHAYLTENEQAILAGRADLDPYLVRSWAQSANPRLRRRAAEHPALPTEMIPILAADPDAAVRANLALHQPAAPGELLLSCYLDGRHRSRLLALPQFPHTGLAHFADHPDHLMRCLVARDPGTDPTVIDNLTRDPDSSVRRTMARCPRLPAGRVTALLDDPELAEHAAANPALDWRSVLAAYGGISQW
ncbi:hypothetical protein SAMN04489716_1177 [Actinoplanes derwentensis]|uniref:Leucine rich repeat variant n=1 Tax=Actinoplanes derwentensis TaxID=113562 RepID=A0A1H1TLQ8_9ACTN|nr:hypothetical protein Ade03nite_39930 [Actinoplanes derwentensis]SDS61177.1 hypothetical protein SAMN04489716_1177 [Actinoplanes derwentensis]